MLAIRNFPQENMTYKEFLEKVKSNVLDAFAHQDMQFEKLVDKLGLEKTTGRNPLFEVAINVQNYEQPTLPVQDLEILPHEMEFKIAKFDLLLWANEITTNTGKEIRFALEYSTELFKQSTAKIICKHLAEIARQTSENPDIKLKDIHLSHQLTRTDTKNPQVEFEF